MQLRITTDYAIRMVYELAKRKGEYLTSGDLVNAVGTSSQYIIQIGTMLRRSGILASAPYHGYSLAKSPKDITLLDVISVVEPTVKISKSLENDNDGGKNAKFDYPVHEVYKKLQSDIESRLSSITFENLLE